MHAANKLLDNAKEACSLATDIALAERIGVSRAQLSSWRKGREAMPEERIAQIARIAHVDAGEWLLLIEAEQARGEARKAYGALVKRLGIAALLGLFATPAWAGTQHAIASVAGVDIGALMSSQIGIMRSRLRRAWARLRAGFGVPLPLCDVPPMEFAA